VCPIRTACAGKDAPERYPPPRKRPERPLLEWTALALTRRDGAVLLARRPAGLFAGLWDLPPEGPVPGIRVGATADVGIVEQTLTHREVRVRLLRGAATGTPRGDGVRWVLPRDLGQVGLSSLARKALRKAGIASA
jgi:adenine-specific DNA glycosylase